MKFLKIFFFVLIYFSCAFGLKEGEDYITLKKPIPNAQNTIIELFNVGCPHCATYYEFLPDLFEILPLGVTFKPYHIATSQPFSDEISEILATMLVLDANEGKTTLDLNSHYHRVLEYYFTQIHKTQKNWESKKSLKEESLKIARVSPELYDKTQKEAKGHIKEWKDSLEYARIQGVPSFIVNGKYLILAKNLESFEDLAYKIDFLLRK